MSNRSGKKVATEISTTLKKGGELNNTQIGKAATVMKTLGLKQVWGSDRVFSLLQRADSLFQYSMQGHTYAMKYLGCSSSTSTPQKQVYNFQLVGAVVEEKLSTDCIEMHLTNADILVPAAPLRSFGKHLKLTKSDFPLA